MTLEEILGEYGSMLGRIVASYEFNPALQQELMQEISLAIWRSLPRYSGASSIKTYVAKIAQNRAISHVEKSAKVPKTSEISLEMPAENPGPSEAADKSQRTSRLLGAVRALPVKQRQVVTLILEGFSHKEVAATLNLTESATMVRYSRAKVALKAMIAER